jgi:glycosyltransferase involved in cell wall biosynthesis
MALRVGINAVFLGEQAGGVGRYTRQLLAALIGLDNAPELTVFAGSRLPAGVLREPWADEVRWVRMPVSPKNRLNVGAQLLGIPVLARLRRLDLIHSPGNTGPVWAPLPTVVTLHDLIWLHHPTEWHRSRRARASTRALAIRTAEASTRVLADSRAARDDFIETLGLAPQKIDVAPLAADGGEAAPEPEASLRTSLGLGDRRFILAVAQKRRYKRLDTLIRALTELDDEVALVLVGPSTPHEDELRETARGLRVADRVLFIDWVSESSLETLYRACTCFALPTIIEGFGLPVLEAMRRGVPVACSGRSSLPEVAGDAALYFDPDNQEQVTAAIRRLMEDSDLRARLASAGRQRAASFSWRRTAEATLASYDRAAASRRRYMASRGESRDPNS